MGILKIGKEEEMLIREIEDFKTTFKARCLDIEFGIEIAMKQVPDNSIASEIEISRDKILQLATIVEGISFSKQLEENEFSVAWLEYLDKSKQYYKQSYGCKTSQKKPVTESQFVYALMCWEKEVCKRMEIFQQVEEKLFRRVFSDVEHSIHKIIYEYVNSPKS